MSSRVPPSATRRAALAGTAAVLLGACDLARNASSETPAPAATGPPSGSPSGSPTGSFRDPDLVLLDDAATAAAEAQQLLRAVRRTHPGLRRSLRPMVTMHEDHLAVLTDAGATVVVTKSPNVPTDRESAAAQVLAGESRLQRELSRRSMRADQGAVARLLSVLAAGIASHLGHDAVGPQRSSSGRADGAEALQDTLTAEHAAVFVYGVLGGRTSQSATTRLFGQVRSAYDVHRSRRDELTRWLREAGAEPVAPAPEYLVDPVPTTPTQVRESAAGIEASAAEAYAAQVSSTTGAYRRWANTALIDSAVRARTFGAPATSFPGAPELRP